MQLLCQLIKVIAGAVVLYFRGCLGVVLTCALHGCWPVHCMVALLVAVFMCLNSEVLGIYVLLCLYCHWLVGARIACL